MKVTSQHEVAARMNRWVIAVLIAVAFGAVAAELDKDRDAAPVVQAAR